MPWKERKLMEERKRFIHEIMQSTGSFNATCLEFRISRKTGYKWLYRFEKGGYPDLKDQSLKVCGFGKKQENSSSSFIMPSVPIMKL